MTVHTHVDDARDRAAAERDAVAAKVEGFDAFLDRVASIPPDKSRSASPVPAGSTGTDAGPGPSAGAVAGVSAAARSTATDDGCAAVRSAFAETVRPHSVADVDDGDAEPPLETVRSELSDQVAVAIAPTTDGSFSPACKRMLRVETRNRREEAAVLRQALDREIAHLEDAASTVDRITGWIAEVEERPLPELGFDALAERHETLADHREACTALAADRQAFLRETTSESVEVGVRHDSLPPYLYEDFAMDHPVLATAARLDDVCAECQRAVRKHLTRRG